MDAREITEWAAFFQYREMSKEPDPQLAWQRLRAKAGRPIPEYDAPEQELPEDFLARFK